MHQEKHLLVVSIIRGRKFTERQNYNLIAEAKFDNEILTSDPVSHADEPNFDQELAWELDKHSLRQHKLQRSSIKIQLYAIENIHCTKQLLGYFIFDIRSANQKKKFIWAKILHSKYKPSPEVQCAIYIESDVQNEQILTNNRVFQQHQLNSSYQPKLCIWADSENNREYFQIGPPNQADDNFEFFIKKLSVTNMLCLNKNNEVSHLANVSNYTIFINVFGIKTLDLKLDEIGNATCLEKLSIVNIRSTTNILQTYLSNNRQMKLTIDLNNGSSAFVNVSLINHMQTINTGLLNPVDVEISIPLLYIGSNSDEIEKYLTDNLETSSLTMHFTLQRASINSVSSLMFPVQRSNNAFRGEDLSKKIETEVDFDLNAAMRIQHEECIDYNPSLPINSYNPTDEVLFNSGEDADDKTIHRFCFSIELKTIQGVMFNQQKPCVYARYVYPLFGNRTPIMTLPPISLCSNQESTFSQGFCTFELAASFSELKERVSMEPLILEILDRNADRGGGELIFGQTKISLAEVFLQKAIKTNYCSRRRVDDTVDVLFDSVKVAHLTYSLQLEDFGPYSFPRENNGNIKVNNSPNTKCKSSISPNRAIQPSYSTEAQPPTCRSSAPLKDDGCTYEVRNTPEYRTALELELWRADQETQFTASLREREQKLMSVFADEWQKRENERELICKKKLSEYQSLETKLRTVLDNLTAREHELSIGEAELRRLKSEAQKDMDIRHKEISVNAQRRVLDAEHQCALQKAECDNLRAQIVEWQNKYVAVECEKTRCEVVKNSQNYSHPDSTGQNGSGINDSHEGIKKLQLEVVRVSTELIACREQLNTTEKRLDQALRTRLRYKELWTRALHEVARLKQESERITRQTLQRREEEIDNLRKRYMRIEERSISSMEKVVQKTTDEEGFANTQPLSIAQLRNELQRLQTVSLIQNKDVKTDASTQPPLLEAQNTQIAKLKEEHECLLNSGVYDEDDQIIIDIDGEIKRLLGNLNEIPLSCSQPFYV